MPIAQICGLTVLFLAAALCAWRVAAMSRAWRTGRSVAVDWRSGFKALPSRYLKDVHDVVARQPRNARMHATLAGGTLGAIAVLPVSLLLPPMPSVAAVIWCLAAVACVGLVLECRRRIAVAPGLSTGVYGRLPYLFAATLLFATLLPLSRFLVPGQAILLALAAFVLGLCGLGGLALMAGNGPMRHVFAGVVNLVVHPRPERFGGGRSTGLKPLALDAEPLGVGDVTEFSFPQLASFDACVQCGRCEVVCPAFAAGLPLNPKKLVNDLSESLRGPGATSYAGNDYPSPSFRQDDGMRLPLIFAGGKVSIDPQAIWSCTTCRACVEACPMMIEHVDAIVDLRRAQVLRVGAVAAHAQDVLENLRDTQTQGGHDLDARFDWAVDLDIVRARVGERNDILLWAGESAYDRRSQRTLRSLVRLLRRAGVNVAVLGEEELDCGDQARRLGDEATFQVLARRNVATLSKYDFGTIVTADPHALHVLRNEYPAFGGRFTVRHHSDVLAELLGDGRLVPASRIGAHLTYHDPCYLGRYNGEFEAPRRILAAIAPAFSEMERSRARSHCCGGGGGAPLTDVPGERRIPDMRMEQVAETGADCVAVACPGCTAMLEGVPNAGATVRDVAELLEQAMEPQP